MTNLNQSIEFMAAESYKPYSVFKQNTRKTPHYNLLVTADDGCFYQLPYIQLWSRKFEEYQDKISGKWLITGKLETANIVLELNFINFAKVFHDFLSELGSFNVENIIHCKENLHAIDFPAVKVRCLHQNEARFFGSKSVSEELAQEA